MYSELLEIGRGVHCTLYGGKTGAIYDIRGEQSPESCRSLGGVIATGGSAEVDIVWQNGTTTSAPESLVRTSSQWQVLDDIYTQDDIDHLLANAKVETGRRAQLAQADADKAQRQREQYREDFPYLTHASNGDGGAKLAAKNIRVELKRRFPKTRFSVRLRRGGGSDALNVSWTDGPTVEQVTTLLNKYKRGSFNGMQDIYEVNTANVWPCVFGGVSYLFTEREDGDAQVAKAIDALFEEYAVNFERAGIDKPTVEEFRSGRLHRVLDPARHLSGGQSLQSDIRGWLAKTSCEEPAEPDPTTRD